MGGGQPEGGQSAEMDSQDRGMLDPLIVQYGQRVTRPLFHRRGIRRAQRIRQTNPPQVEPNQPREGGQSVHIGLPEWLFGDCIYREERAVGYLDEIEGRAPFDLIRDVKAISRCGVPSIRLSLHVTI